MDSRLIAVLERARELGFLGPGPINEHVEHSLAFLDAWDGLHGAAPGRLLDLGAGGGVPGLVLAASWSGTETVLLDASARRCAFLLGAVDELGMAGSVSVVESRAELAARRPDLERSFDLVTSRSFGAPAVTAECSARFLREGGHLVVSEPPAPQDPEERWPAAGLALLGLGPACRAQGRRNLVVITLERPCPERFPRRDGQPAKKPLF